MLSGMPALVLGGIPAGLALKRITEAQRIWQERSRLSGHAPAFMSFADLALVMRSFETPRLSPDEPRSAIRQTGMTRAAAIRLIGADLERSFMRRPKRLFNRFGLDSGFAGHRLKRSDCMN